MHSSKKGLLIASTMLAALLCFMGSLILGGKSEHWIKDRAVKLVSPRGSCSGEQVKAPSGISYILTAAHCKVLEQNGNIHVVLEDGRELDRRIISEDPNSDLLLLEGIPGLEGLNTARSVRKDEHVRTFTHGAGLDLYKTEGDLIQYHEVQVIVDYVIDDAELKGCDMPKYKKLNLDLFFFKIKACVLDVMETVTTAKIVPGSSGGMVVDDHGDLVGVVSAGDGLGFGYLVNLKDIQNFLAVY